MRTNSPFIIAWDFAKVKKDVRRPSRSKFDNYLTAVRLLLTKVPQYVLPFWYGKEPMFWLPYGWFPYYAEWIISFPRAPLGSVSAPSWQLACSGLVTLASELLVFAWAAAAGRKAAEGAREKAEAAKGGAREKMAVPAGGPSEKKL